jgi:uncharacterized protein
MSANNWISTLNRHHVHPLNLTPREIDIRDIAHALSRICRYTGHGKHFYSVGQHSCYVSIYCPSEYKLWGLLHDASEAYIADIASPIKNCPELAGYRAVEKRIMTTICKKFNLPTDVPAIVSSIDKLIVDGESRYLKLWRPDWNTTHPSLELKISPWTMQFTEEFFLSLFKEYME